MEREWNGNGTDAERELNKDLTEIEQKWNGN